jgi:hypothetical protein
MRPVKNSGGQEKLNSEKIEDKDVLPLDSSP